MHMHKRANLGFLFSSSSLCGSAAATFLDDQSIMPPWFDGPKRLHYREHGHAMILGVISVILSAMPERASGVANSHHHGEETVGRLLILAVFLFAAFFEYIFKPMPLLFRMFEPM
jgi:hypothetical protein